MLETAVAILVISLITAALAALLLVAERFICNYGECVISVNDDRQFSTQGGGPLLEALRSEGIFIPSACGGRGTCGYCKVKTVAGAGTLLPTEAPFLDDREKSENIRLSCLVKVRNDIQIEVPAELLAVREYTCRCSDIIDLTHDIKEFRFRLEVPAAMDFIPGQYVQILVPPYNGNAEEVYRAYSISSNPSEKDFLETIIRLVPGGICTTYCFNHLAVGDTVTINGPYGDFCLSDTDAPIVFVAGGSGKLVADGQERPFQEGDGMLIPPGVEHIFVNDGDAPLEFLMISESIPEGTVPQNETPLIRNYRESNLLVSHWSYLVHPIFGQQDGLVQMRDVLVVLIDPLLSGDGHGHGPDMDEVWTVWKGEAVHMVGKEACVQTPGTAVSVCPSHPGHTLINHTEEPVYLFYFCSQDYNG